MAKKKVASANSVVTPEEILLAFNNSELVSVDENVINIDLNENSVELVTSLDISGYEINTTGPNGITIKNNNITLSGNNSNVIGCFVVMGDNITLSGLNVTHKYQGGEAYPGKNGVSAYTDNLTITNCTFTNNSVDTTVSNGLCLFPKTENATFTITGNTFSNYDTTSAGKFPDVTYNSVGIYMCEQYNVSQKVFFGLEEGVISANLKDKSIDVNIENNTFDNVAINYIRATFDGDPDVNWGQIDKYCLIDTAEGLSEVINYTNSKENIIKFRDNIDLGYYYIKASNPVTIEGNGKTLKGSFVIDSEQVTIKDLTIEHKYDGSNESASKNGINLYGNSIDVTGCTISPAEGSIEEPNGIVIFPRGDINTLSEETNSIFAYNISNNSFSGYNKATTNEMYLSSAIFIAQEYPMEKKPFFGEITGTSTTLPSDFDYATLVNGNTYIDCSYEYLQQSGFDWSKPDVNQEVEVAYVADEKAIKNAITYNKIMDNKLTQVVINKSIELTDLLDVNEVVELTPNIAKDEEIVLTGQVKVTKSGSKLTNLNVTNTNSDVALNVYKDVIVDVVGGKYTTNGNVAIGYAGNNGNIVLQDVSTIGSVNLVDQSGAAGTLDGIKNVSIDLSQVPDKTTYALDYQLVEGATNETGKSAKELTSSIKVSGSTNSVEIKDSTGQVVDESDTTPNSGLSWLAYGSLIDETKYYFN